MISASTADLSVQNGIIAFMDLEDGNLPMKTVLQFLYAADAMTIFMDQKGMIWI